MILRQSTIKTWMSCPLQARFKFIDGLPGKPGSRATFGSCVHAALERYNLTGDMTSSRELFLKAWDDPGAIGLPPIEVWNKGSTVGGLRTRGLDILDAYHDRMRWEQRSVICAEHTFLVPFGRHELTGTVDLVEVRKNHKGKQLLVVADYKTGTRAPTVTELSLDVQICTYLWAVQQPEFWYGHPGTDFKPVENADWYYELTKAMPKRGLWIHLWGDGKEIDAGSRTDTDFARLYRVCNEIENAIEKQVFVPKIGPDCAICDYSHDPCPVEVPSREEWLGRIDDDENAWADDTSLYRPRV